MAVPVKAETPIGKKNRKEVSMKRVIAFLLIVTIMLLVGCKSQPDHQMISTGDSVKDGLLDSTGQPSDNASSAGNLSDVVETTLADTTSETVAPETTEPETTDADQSDWREPDTEPPTEAPTEPETTSPVPTDPETTDPDTTEQTTNAPTETSHTEPDTTPIEDGKPNTDAGWGPIV